MLLRAEHFLRHPRAIRLRLLLFLARAINPLLFQSIRARFFPIFGLVFPLSLVARPLSSSSRERNRQADNFDREPKELLMMMTCRVKCSISAWAASWSRPRQKKSAPLSAPGIDTKNLANLAPFLEWFQSGGRACRKHGGRGRVGECFEFINNAGWQLPITFCLQRLFPLWDDLERSQRIYYVFRCFFLPV